MTSRLPGYIALIGGLALAWNGHYLLAAACEGFALFCVLTYRPY